MAAENNSFQSILDAFKEKAPYDEIVTVFSEVFEVPLWVAKNMYDIYRKDVVLRELLDKSDKELGDLIWGRNTRESLRLDDVIDKFRTLFEDESAFLALRLYMLFEYFAKAPRSTVMVRFFKALDSLTIDPRQRGQDRTQDFVNALSGINGVLGLPRFFNLTDTEFWKLWLQESSRRDSWVFRDKLKALQKRMGGRWWKKRRMRRDGKGRKRTVHDYVFLKKFKEERTRILKLLLHFQ